MLPFDASCFAPSGVLRKDRRGLQGIGRAGLIRDRVPSAKMQHRKPVAGIVAVPEAGEFVCVRGQSVQTCAIHQFKQATMGRGEQIAAVKRRFHQSAESLDAQIRFRVFGEARRVQRLNRDDRGKPFRVAGVVASGEDGEP